MKKGEFPTKKPGPGRPKGVPNRTTTLLKDAILLAAEKAGEDNKGKGGLVGYLTKQAKENPAPFMALLGKVLPTQLTGENGDPIKFEEVSARERIAGRIARAAARAGAAVDPEKPDGS
jgi:hypothetical protein